MGGAETVLCDLIKNLDTALFEHHVIFFHEGPHLKTLQTLGVKTYQVKGLFCLYDPVFFMRLLFTVKKLRPSLIHTMLWAANVAGRVVGKMVGIPVVSVYHNNVDQDGQIRALFDQATLAYAQTLVAVSPGVAQSLYLRSKKLIPGTIQVIQNGIDVHALHAQCNQALTRSAVGLSDDAFVIGSVGRFVPVKRYNLLIDAFADIYAQNQRCRLVLVGIGPLEQELRQQARDLGIDAVVRFVIGQPACHYYLLFDCFVQTTDKEGISIALLEAMSFGLPCVVTHSDAVHPVITDGVQGFKISAGDKQGLVRSILSIAGDHDLRSSFSRYALQTISDNFRIEPMIAAYHKIFLASCK